ncbi:hypothetical protein [Pleionea sp. CnH1-48]|uniref:hypothetical protein n=1 Tax=Pleionea sp. CnH1-48 TaxID=2954494 RepID=UPI0020981EE1|nr:hypothetical protein [Pleionea sp. CnH1-48]MCO7226069.1 hypothetical protein [Pleionea sp. CnH1-48]
MINKSDLIATAHVALIGCVTPALRMLKVLFSEAQHKIFVIAYFDSVPKVYEKELISDISGEIECSLVDARYECHAVCVQAAGSVIGSLKVERFESETCDSILFSEICYLRFGEGGGHDELSPESYEKLDLGEYQKIE